VIIVLRLHKEILDKSHKFATMWQPATLLDYRLTNNICANSLHKRLYEVKQEEKNSAKLRFLDQDWGLILQVNQGCSYCHTFAPIAQEFALQAPNWYYDFTAIKHNIVCLEFTGCI
ncbi:hypothetical protein MHYMCMPASI_01146, partial [Hyalomma marginatum]